MSTTGQFSSRNPTIKRILKEASELAQQPSSDYHAAPLESDLFEWHFTVRGPPAPSAFDGGIYHGRIVLPPAYPLKPPSFRFLTPTGRFEVNREICLSISGHHEETWQPAWGIRTALVAIRSFMDTSASGQLGGMDASDELRRRLATQSVGWKCPACGRSNAETMTEQDAAAREQGGERKEEVLPEELRLAYRDDLKPGASEKAAEGVAAPPPAPVPALAPDRMAQAQATPVVQAPNQTPIQSPMVTRAAGQPQARTPTRPRPGIPAWIDQAIYGIIAVLIFLVWKRLAW